MIKFHIKNGGAVRVKASGRACDCMLETAMAIKEIYRGIRKRNPEAAHEYRTHLLGLLLDPKSPVWEEDNHG